jgi:membrane protein implicated in regulation of membrane protease activity
MSRLFTAIVIGIMLFVAILVGLALVGYLIPALALLFGALWLVVILAIVGGVILTAILGPYYLFKRTATQPHGVYRLEDQKEE